jgi:polysaccharide biosynthesis protein PslJ
MVVVLFPLNPLWWVLGLGDFAWCVMAVPLWLWILHRRRLDVPASVGLFTVYVAWTLVTAIRLDRFTRVLAFGFRTAAYLTAIGLAIYVHNERLVTRERFVRWVSWFWVAAIAGGYLGLVLPHGRIGTTFASVLLPSSITSNDFVGNLVRPGFAQVQDLGGLAGLARPKTLFSFTNEWGGNVALLTPFFVATYVLSSDPRRRRFGRVALAFAMVPMIASANRGLWLSLAVLLTYLAVRTFFHGSTAVLRALVTIVLGLGVLMAATPLGTVVFDRVTESSADTRVGIYQEAIDGAKASPVLGWGGPRPSENPFSPSIGTHGHLWFVMFSHGFVGLALYGTWLVASLAVVLRPKDPLSIVIAAVPVIGALQIGFYNLLPTSLPIILLAIGLVTRGDDPPSPPDLAARTEFTHAH